VSQKDMAVRPDAVIVRVVGMIVRHGAIVPFKDLKTKLFSVRCSNVMS